MLHIDIEVADKHHRAIGTNALLATAKLARLHVALHDVDPFLSIERDPTDLVKADHVVLTHQAALPTGVVHKHLGDGGLPA
ncbi:hypothetical protein D3C80_2106010 [compost metagenome]